MPGMSDGSPPLNYSSYLHLDELLGAQHPRSNEHELFQLKPFLPYAGSC